MTYLLIAFISYLLGTFPTALILVKILTKKDVRSGESGNMGAMNTLRMVKKYEGLPAAIISFFTVWLVDCSKAILAVIIAQKLNSNFVMSTTLATFFVILGHNYPIWLKGHGGRGASCLMGIMMYSKFSVLIYWLLTVFLSSLIFEIIFRIFKKQTITPKIIFQSISNQILGRLIGEIIAVFVIYLIYPSLFYPILFGTILILLRHTTRLKNQLKDQN